MFKPEKLKQAREEKGFSTTDAMFCLSTDWGYRVSNYAIICYENGKTTPTANKLEIMAKAYEKPIGYFF